jgi:hypothetical protein
MNPSRPTRAELAERVHKQRHREIGNWLARRVGRPSAVYGTWLAVRIGLSAHQVTLAALLVSLAGACAIGMGQRWLFVVGDLLLWLAFWLDHVDGQVARWWGTESLDGVYFDYLMHHAGGMALGFAVGYGLAAQSGEMTWTIAGAAIAVGWTLLSVQNDCRYKALFQRLKSTKGSYRTDGGAGGRPQPPAPWPRKGIGALTWPLYKACEAHVVLMTLTALALFAVAAPGLWLSLWGAWSALMAVLAPSLGIARAARSVRRGSVEEEFARWFRPLLPYERSAVREREPTRREG